MKMLFAAVALAIAAPAVAQSAPDHHAGHGAAAPAAPGAADPHADHERHAEHSKQAGCCVKGADGKMACKHDKADGKKMDCCKDHAAGHAPKAGHKGH